MTRTTVVTTTLRELYAATEHPQGPHSCTADHPGVYVRVRTHMFQRRPFRGVSQAPGEGGTFYVGVVDRAGHQVGVIARGSALVDVEGMRFPGAEYTVPDPLVADLGELPDTAAHPT